MRTRLILTLPRMAASVAVARKTLDGILGTFGVASDCRQDIAIAVSEACSNAIRHADGEATYELRVETQDDECVITVNDNSWGMTVPPSRAMPRPTATTGRGLALIGLTMDRVELAPGPTGGLSTRLFKRLRWMEGAVPP